MGLLKLHVLVLPLLQAFGLIWIRVDYNHVFQFSAVVFSLVLGSISVF